MISISSVSTRRDFIRKAASLSSLPLLGYAGYSKKHLVLQEVPANSRIRLSCNLYSFNDPLQSGKMTLEEVIRFCAGLGLDAVDPTGYYFPGYPDAPEDAFLYDIKKKTFLLGLDISGTGVRNDFTQADKSKREADIALVHKWVEVAAKLGAPLIRIFAGKAMPQGYAEEEMMGWVLNGIKACVAYGEQKGVIIVLQNHNEFLKTADQVLYIREQIASDWFGLNVDIGSLRQGDPYEEIARLAPYAYTWQIKENVYRAGKEEKTDLKKIISILREAGYRGYIPLETLGPGDPKVKIRQFLEEARQALYAS